MRLKEGDKEKDILFASTEVFARLGYGQAKISDIADKAKIATGSVYLYFNNKEEILLRILFDLWNEIYENSIEIVGRNLDPHISLDLILTAALDTLMKDKNLATIYGNEQNLWMIRKKGSFNVKYQHFLDLLKQLYTRGEETGHFKKNLNKELVIDFIIGGIRNLVHKWSLENSKLDKKSIQKEIINLAHFTILST